MNIKQRLKGFWGDLKTTATDFGEIDPFTQAGFHCIYHHLRSAWRHYSRSGHRRFLL